MTTTYSTEHERAAHAFGVEAAKAAASWVIDGNTSPLHVEHVLYLLDGGDPEAEQYLPARPNLSGEWADAPTPQTLARDVYGAEELDRLPRDDFDRVRDAIADAWEAGVNDTFEAECERILRAALPDDDD